jgi:hypothetical protein
VQPWPSDLCRTQACRYRTAVREALSRSRWTAMSSSNPSLRAQRSNPFHFRNRLPRQAKAFLAMTKKTIEEIQQPFILPSLRAQRSNPLLYRNRFVCLRRTIKLMVQ